MYPGTWGIGALIANLVDIPLVNYLPPHIAWRVGCSIGAFLGLVTMIARRSLPESPRWLLSKGRKEEAEQVCLSIEKQCGQPDNAIGIPPKLYEVKESQNFFRQCWTLWTRLPLQFLFASVMDLSYARPSHF